MFLGNIVFHDPKEFADPHISDGLKVISNESMDFNDAKEFDDPQVFGDPKEILIGSTLTIQKSAVIPRSSMVLF